MINKFYNLLLSEKLLTLNQSGFCPSDSCINQLLAITDEKFEAFDYNPSLEVRSLFVDKHLTRFGMKDYFIRVWASQENFITFLKTI